MSLTLLGTGCGDVSRRPCEERAGATAELSRTELTIESPSDEMDEALVLSAEIAAGDDRDTAWAGRRCGLDALIWVPDAVEPA
ncbi:MAG: hypothetical protein K0V04_44465, partial [Deltaproteobacteria bacterium]|nr:hypothetical protein [Deltaproteobacteria bacterium]